MKDESKAAEQPTCGKAAQSNTQRKIDVMAAFDRGETIEGRGRDHGHGEFKQLVDPSWNWMDYEYRVKPKPRVLWYLENQDSLRLSRVNSEQDGFDRLARLAAESACMGYRQTPMRLVSFTENI